MKKLKLIVQVRLMLFIILTFSLSCSKDHKNVTPKDNSFYTIPFNEIVKTKREVKLSEFATDVEFIQFENTPEAFLGTFEDIEYTRDYYFVMCWDQAILQFSHTGKLIRQIGSLGKGPEEYLMCMKMCIDEGNEKVYVHTTLSSILVYNFQGKYIKTIKNPALERTMKFWIWARDSMLLSYFEPVEGNEPFVFIEHNEQGDTLQTIQNHIFFGVNEQADPFQMSPFDEQNFSYRFENKLHLKGCYNDTVYTYDENNIFVPKYFIDLGKHKLPDDLIYERKWKQRLPDGLCWTGVHETTNYLFISYGYHFDQNKPESEMIEKGLVLYNKKTKEGIATKETQQGGFVNDITGGPNFRPILTNDSSAIMLVSALEMKQYLNSDKFKNKEVKLPAKIEELNQLKNTLNEADNHFLVLVKF
ncbi:MAG TPA: 6-bladed beta-propeller [Prolixibacteraceae bacterium]|nr:6-bladed beta-propeller [Prolixibacteraceae bacterium]